MWWTDGIGHVTNSEHATTRQHLTASLHLKWLYDRKDDKYPPLWQPSHPCSSGCHRLEGSCTWREEWQFLIQIQICPVMNQIYIKTPKSECRPYWCLIEFIDWRYSQSCWYFRLVLWSISPLTFSLVSSRPLPCENKYIVHPYTVCKGGSMGS
jgi:hypothetical protein